MTDLTFGDAFNIGAGLIFGLGCSALTLFFLFVFGAWLFNQLNAWSDSW
jgi:hypothetical protein